MLLRQRGESGGLQGSPGPIPALFRSCDEARLLSQNMRSCNPSITSDRYKVKPMPARLPSLLGMAGLSGLFVVLTPAPALAIPIAARFLPVRWAALWWLVSLPLGLVSLRPESPAGPTS
jgi:hypothetical protein